MVKGSMWRNLGCSQQPFLLSNEFFSCSPTDNPLSLNSETLGLPKLQSVQQAGEYASFPKVPTVPSGQESLPEIPDSQLRRFTLVFFPKNALSSAPRAPLGSRDGEYAPLCCERATSIIRT